MSSALILGPLALPLPPLLLLAASALGHTVGVRLGRRHGLDLSALLLRWLLIGLVAARLAFVWQWRSLYFHAPWTLLDTRDGGWEPAAGFVVAALWGLQRARREPGLQRPLVAALAVTLLAWGAGQVALSAAALHERRPLPALTLPALQGDPVPLQAFVGRPTVVNLWATWCPPCRAEMPMLQAAQAANPDIHFVFVDQGEAPAVVSLYLRLQGLALRNVLIDERRATAAAFNEQALPTTLFFDARGQLVTLRVGAMSGATLAQQLQQLKQSQQLALPLAP